MSSVDDSSSTTDSESDTTEDNEATDSFSSFDDSEDDIKDYSNISDGNTHGELSHSLETDKENVKENGSGSQELQTKGLTECKEFLRKLSIFIWNSLAKSQNVSLLKDFIESEFFLIDGDSLFITCMWNKTLKKGQNLHFFYIVEQFLHNFNQKDARYVIVFFKDVENIFFNHPELLSLRTALIQHLEHNTQVPIHTEFSSCLSPEWEIFLKESYPYFLIVSDEGITSRQTDYLNIFILHALQKKINVVLASEQETNMLRIFGYQVQPLYSHWKFFEQHKNELHQAHEVIIRSFQVSPATELLLYKYLKLNVRNMNKEVHQTMSLLRNMWPEGADIKSIVCSLSCSVVLKTYKNMIDGVETSEEPREGKEESAQDCDKALTLEEAADLCRMLCLSVAFLQLLPLSQRAKSRIIHCNWKKKLSPFLRMLKRCEFFILKEIKTISQWKVDFTFLPDLTDNLLWKNIAYYYEVENCTGLNLEVGDGIMEKYEKMWNTILNLSGDYDFGGSIPVRRTLKHFLTQKEISTVHKPEIPKLGLIPLTSQFVEDYVGDILGDLPFLSNVDPSIISLSKRKEFDERKHWHSNRPLDDDYRNTNFNNNANSKDSKKQREVQKLYHFYHVFGESLNGRHRSMRIVNQVTAPLPTKTSQQKKIKSKSNADKIIEENLKRKQAEIEKKEQDKWTVMSVIIENEIKENVTNGIKNLENFLKTCGSNSIKFLAEMVGMEACFMSWKEHCLSREENPKDINIAVQLMKRVHMILGKYPQFMKERHRKKLAKCLKYLGFDNLAESLYSEVKNLVTEDISKYSVHMGAARFQLSYMGHYLFREERSDPDPRVHHFIPDTWQRELLDVVDNNESAVIVAPTSSGKTYVSYYCMEKILKTSDEGVVVYVSPTKALINQVVGTVYSVFNKRRSKGGAICGVFTRDYRHDVMNSQILVTVPQCLEILLLSPHHQKWVKRIKYVIFDEVHCLGGEIGAEVWEHLLVMIRCPFLALSATISNPEYLTEWLASVKRYWQSFESMIDKSTSSKITLKGSKQNLSKTEKPSYRVRLVLYKERYNDLEKYVCSLKDDDFLISHYHPCAALTVNHIEKYGIPSDLGFSPRESIQLYDAMVQVWPEWPRVQDFEPEEFSCFKEKVVIMKTDSKKYEEELKKEIINWIHLDRDKVNQLLKYLKPVTFDNAEGKKRRKFAGLVEKLKEMDKLPAIFFLFNIHMVENSAFSILKNIRSKQKNHKNLNDEKEMKKMIRVLRRTRRTLRANLAAYSKKNSMIKAEKILSYMAEMKEIKRKIRKLTEIPPKYSYANPNSVDHQTLWKILHRIKYGRNASALKALAAQGIGYHHSSMQYKERQVVEMLFRLGYIKVVTATGSLALGINMPCKSVIFTEDSVFLDALNFRQMSGRAGRRGEDLIGNVFFYDIPLPKVQRLLKSNVPQLRGQFPLSISLVLRLMILVMKADDKEDAKAKVLSVLQHSMMSFNQPKMKHMLKVYFIFSLQFLVREGYLDQECIPRGFSGLAIHLHYHEPSNFVLISFLEKGLFHKLCQPMKLKGPKVFSENVMETLVLVLANLFGRRYLPSCVKRYKRTFSQSKVILNDLPKEFAAAAEEYNHKIENDFGSFLLIISELADMKKEYQLPLSEIDFSGEECRDSELVSHLMPGMENRTAVSPFACLSEITDQDLFNIDMVNDIVLRTIDVHDKNAPYFWLKKFDRDGSRHHLNAYAFDFYKHGSMAALALDNGLNKGDAFAAIKDFGLLIQAIRISLAELCDDEQDDVVLAFGQLSDAYCKKIWGKEKEQSHRS
ncbi:probable ATP-dependent RNA helicase DDX60 isoform X2 [Monodelphis domestica]|uniref:probable ATP-dependent RNA helicase DDX60 isoform X2 n=1 Tax=Monodelphis domestica TaxID=13616 RepID=UPI0024E22D26|nr:probable ATP-dependent RNA helicase DDX60 isoform X2 [Monodelphis domestica]